MWAVVAHTYMPAVCIARVSACISAERYCGGLWMHMTGIRAETMQLVPAWAGVHLILHVGTVRAPATHPLQAAAEQGQQQPLLLVSAAACRAAPSLRKYTRGQRQHPVKRELAATLLPGRTTGTRFSTLTGAATTPQPPTRSVQIARARSMYRSVPFSLGWLISSAAPPASQQTRSCCSRDGNGAEQHAPTLQRPAESQTSFLRTYIRR
jgi:hypothetical protein